MIRKSRVLFFAVNLTLTLLSTCLAGTTTAHPPAPPAPASSDAEPMEQGVFQLHKFAQSIGKETYTIYPRKRRRYAHRVAVQVYGSRNARATHGHAAPVT